MYDVQGRIARSVVAIRRSQETKVCRECCLIKLRPYILFEKYINILAFEMACPGNRHCANCIGTLSFPISSANECNS